MATVAMSGSDTIILQERLLTDLADGDAVGLTFPDDIAVAKTGKNGNTIYSFSETGRRVEVIVRVIRGGQDDKFLNNLLIQMQSNFAGFVLMTGEFTKKIGDGQGKINSDKYILSGGIFTRNVEGKMNAEGDTEQSVAIYTMNFTNAPRAIG